MTDSAEKYPVASNTGVSKQKKRSPGHAMNPIALSSSVVPFPGIDFIFPMLRKMIKTGKQKQEKKQYRTHGRADILVRRNNGLITPPMSGVL